MPAYVRLIIAERSSHLHGFEFNILQRRRQDNSIASAHPAALTQSRDARSDARAWWRDDSARCRNKGGRRMSDKSVDEPSGRRSSCILRIQSVAALLPMRSRRDENSLAQTLFYCRSTRSEEH